MKERLSNILSNKKKKSCAIILVLALIVTVLSVVIYATEVPKTEINIGGDEKIQQTDDKEKTKPPVSFDMGKEILQIACEDSLTNHVYVSCSGSSATCLAYEGQPIFYYEVLRPSTDESGMPFRMAAKQWLEPALIENGVALRLTLKEGAGHYTETKPDDYIVEIIDDKEVLDIYIAQQIKGVKGMPDTCLRKDGSIDYEQFKKDLEEYCSDKSFDFPIQLFSKLMERAGV